MLRYGGKLIAGRQCMNLVDFDRAQVAREAGYAVTLTSLQPLSCSPKNNLLIGQKCSAASSWWCHRFYVMRNKKGLPTCVNKAGCAAQNYTMGLMKWREIKVPSWRGPIVKMQAGPNVDNVRLAQKCRWYKTGPKYRQCHVDLKV